jgi:hypothetical protein
LYASFAAWHFQVGWFVELVTLLAGTVLSAVAIFAQAEK